MKAVHFGAGNIGRGFIGQILHQNNFDIIFVDTDKTIVDQLNQQQGYEIEYINEKRQQFWIDRVRALYAVEQSELVEAALLQADIITTSVGVQNLKHIAATIKRALLKSAVRKSVNILANENAINATALLKDELRKLATEQEWREIEKTTYFVNTSIDRMSLSKTENNRQITLVEPYFEWLIEQSQWSPDTPYRLSAVKFVSNLTPFIERKLFIVNAGHAAFAYIGALFGYQTVQQAIADTRINMLVRAFLTENMAYFVKKYVMSENELNNFIEQTLIRHGNPLLADPIKRVGRSPIRKLGKTDRLVAPVLNLSELSLQHDMGLKIIAIAYLYENQDDTEAVELHKRVEESGITKAIETISGLSGELVNRISKLYREIKCDREKVFN